jgi:hypothetical protein
MPWLALITLFPLIISRTVGTCSARSFHVLVIVHSLSGETESIVEAFVKGLIKGTSRNCLVTYAPIQVDPPFTFPWSFWSFFDIMPETVLPSLNIHCGTRKVKLPLESLSNETFDLIVIGWQTWFLSPSLPVRLALCSPEWQALLRCNSSSTRGAAPPPVLIVGTHRNMWHLASHTLCTELGGVIGAQRIAGRIDFVQQSPFLKSVVDTVRWQLGGTKGSGGVKENATGRAFEYGVFYSGRLRNSKDSSFLSRSVSTMGIIEHDCWFQAGEERRVTIEGVETIWWPVKFTFSAVMGIFPPNSAFRKMLTCIYVPFLCLRLFLLEPQLS